MSEVKLLLGRSMASGKRVSDADFADFVEHSIVPNFPDGFTLSAAQGHYLPKGASAPIHEPAAVLLVIAPDTPETTRRVHAIADAYKRRFAQESVGIVREPVCASF